MIIISIILSTLYLTIIAIIVIALILVNAEGIKRSARKRNLKRIYKENWLKHWKLESPANVGPPK